MVVLINILLVPCSSSSHNCRPCA